MGGYKLIKVWNDAHGAMWVPVVEAPYSALTQSAREDLNIVWCKRHGWQLVTCGQCQPTTITISLDFKKIDFKKIAADTLRDIGNNIMRDARQTPVLNFKKFNDWARKGSPVTQCNFSYGRCACVYTGGECRDEGRPLYYKPGVYLPRSVYERLTARDLMGKR